jgi:hypothetical protein
MSLSAKALRGSSYRLIRLSHRPAIPRIAASIFHHHGFHQIQGSQQAIVSNNRQGHGSTCAVSTEFDPPLQISMVNTHYCREPQLVMIDGYGILQGLMDSSRLLTKYLNIPFATVQDPSKHAVAPESWDGIRDATVLG